MHPESRILILSPMSTVAARSAQLPPPIPVTVRRFRQPKKNIPQTKMERDRILQRRARLRGGARSGAADAAG